MMNRKNDEVAKPTNTSGTLYSTVTPAKPKIVFVAVDGDSQEFEDRIKMAKDRARDAANESYYASEPSQGCCFC